MPTNLDLTLYGELRDYSLLSDEEFVDYFKQKYGDTDEGFAQFNKELAQLFDAGNELLRLDGGGGGIGDWFVCAQECYIRYNRCIEQNGGQFGQNGWTYQLCQGGLRSCMSRCGTPPPGNES